MEHVNEKISKMGVFLLSKGYTKTHYDSEPSLFLKSLAKKLRQNNTEALRNLSERRFYHYLYPQLNKVEERVRFEFAFRYNEAHDLLSISRFAANGYGYRILYPIVAADQDQLPAALKVDADLLKMRARQQRIAKTAIGSSIHSRREKGPRL